MCSRDPILHRNRWMLNLILTHHNKPMKTFALVALLFIAATATIISQGPLTPPGAPAPTMKTLAQVEPRIIVNATNTPGEDPYTFVISQPGSYYLTGHITRGASLND